MPQDYIINWGTEDLEHKKNYFKAWRMFIIELEEASRDVRFRYINDCISENIDSLIAKYNIHFVDIDDIPRVNIDFPKEG